MTNYASGSTPGATVSVVPTGRAVLTAGVPSVNTDCKCKSSVASCSSGPKCMVAGGPAAS